MLEGELAQLIEILTKTHYFLGHRLLRTAFNDIEPRACSAMCTHFADKIDCPLP
jgi:hypothetical protein